jgi:type II secretory ATPase GspE/PulE/Tfp pilus assembly ATPase PilB-like protein
MPIVFYCSSCGKRLKAPDASAGRRLACPKCGKPVDVPGGEEEDALGPLISEWSGRARKAGQGVLLRLRSVWDGVKSRSRRAVGKKVTYMPAEEEAGLEAFAALPKGPGRLANLDIGLHRRHEEQSVWGVQLVIGIATLAMLYGLAVSAYRLIEQLYNNGDPQGFIRALIAGQQPRSVMLAVATHAAMTILTLVALAGSFPAMRMLPQGSRRMRAGLAGILIVVLAVAAIPLVPGLNIGYPDVLGGVMPAYEMVLFGLVSVAGLIALAAGQKSFEAKGPAEHDVIDLVDRLLSEALRVEASDVHVEPTVGSTIVRYRIDGVLHQVAEYPPAVVEKAVARIKVLGSMDIAERRLPQDGGAKMQMAGRTIDLRISTVPSEYGERAVVRLLDPETGLMGFEALGLDKHLISKMEEVINSPNGVFFSTGPTGSGKTTTLYAALMRANRAERNVITVEDPIEYRLPGIAQLPVGRKKGMNFASGLRSILRQDPDVIMVGEVRDEETARMCVEAAQTGHLVMSTLHTNDSAGAVTRLLDLGVEPFLLASCLTAVLAQRLVRVICPECKQPYTPAPSELEELGISLDDMPTFYKGRGCANCMETGYRGRIGLFELLVVDDEVRKLVSKGVDAQTIRQCALERGMLDLRTDGAQKVMQGITTIEEVKRVTQGRLAF